MILLNHLAALERLTQAVENAPDGRKKCGEVQVSNTRPQAPKKVRK